MRCDYCGRDAQRVTGEVIYPHRPDLHSKSFYSCEPCGAYVGCHADGRPFGRLANKELREVKMRAHRLFDPLWQTHKMSRGRAYKWLAEQMGISQHVCHIGMMGLEDCMRVIRVCENLENKVEA